MKPVSPVPNLVFQSVLVRIIGVLAELPLRVDIVTWGLTQPAQGSLAILPFVGPVMESTVQRANDEYSGFLKFSLTYVVEPRLKDCLQLADNIEPLMSKWYYNSSQEADVSVFIGSGCTDRFSMNIMAMNWNILMITCAAGVPSSDHKDLTPTWVTSSPYSEGSFIYLIIQTLLKHGWVTPYVLLDQDANVLYSAVGRAFAPIAGRAGIRPVRGILTTSFKDSSSFQSILKDFQGVSRAMLFLGHAEPFRKMLIEAAHRNMTNGDFVYIAMEAFQHKSFGNFTWNYNDSDDLVARSAFCSAFLIGMKQNLDQEMRMPDEDRLAAKWREDAQTKYNMSYTEDYRPLAYQYGTYLAVSATAKVLNESLLEFTGTKTDLPVWTSGKLLAQRFLNRSFSFNQQESYFNRFGVREVDIFANGFDAVSGTFKPYLQLVAKTHTVSTIGNVSWLSGSPPLNEPRCGFDNLRESCRPHANQGTTVGAVASVIGMIAIGIIVVLAKKRLDRTSDHTWWLLQSDWLYNDRNRLDSDFRQHCSRYSRI
ncbi:hypothetical protein BV898_14033 [Hypsibius exemplaris]|uniref:Receptor ligand binding region domain-containing protein n=1 Tax=Hypsibius exemplaris TaxID=2072580 RepID=A0A1W0W909_HYPEX|nr:hypothetical protein BV898_14033 [Hypsibius exemplaris]